MKINLLTEGLNMNAVNNASAILNIIAFFVSDELFKSNCLAQTRCCLCFWPFSNCTSF